jgi:hypothetical protein
MRLDCFVALARARRRTSLYASSRSLHAPRIRVVLRSLVRLRMRLSGFVASEPPAKSHTPCNMTLATHPHCDTAEERARYGPPSGVSRTTKLRACGKHSQPYSWPSFSRKLVTRAQFATMNKWVVLVVGLWTILSR